ncbi:MAG: helix-turn-helix domain-containing protein [Leucobacter sp.]
MPTPDHRLAFSSHLRALRLEAGWSSQEAFAHHIDLDRTYISGLERGVRNPTLDVLVKVARGLGVRPAELLATIT